jgi:glycosyltransferase involved in cell wall biosynthesis
VAFLLDDLDGGGVQRMTLVLARAFVAAGSPVDIVVCRAHGPLLEAVPPGARLVELPAVGGLAARLAALRADPAGFTAFLRPVLATPQTWWQFRHLTGLAGYLGRERPAALISANPPLNLIAVWARTLAGTACRIVVSERAAPSIKLKAPGAWRKRHLGPLMGRAYARADAVVAVSRALADELATFTGLAPERIMTVYNPVVGPDLAAKAAAPLDDAWLAPGAPPVVLAAGRLSSQKDFGALVRACAILRRERPLRLVILGEAKRPDKDADRRAALQRLAAETGLGDDLRLPGFVANPFAWMARSAVFALSSRFEGLPAVLIQAMACGCQVVSTDCPTGPREILEHGRWGPLVPVGDLPALVDGLRTALDAPVDRAALIGRAHLFSEAAAVRTYRGLALGPVGTALRAAVAA